MAVAFPGEAQVYQPGFKTLGVFIEEPQLRMDLAIWYPAMHQPREISMPPWSFSAALNRKPAEGQFPVILLSHATPADRFAYHELASYLAREGFIVAAPTHNKDSMHNMDNLFTLSQLQARVTELKAALDTVLGDKSLQDSADPKRVGIIGFGSGATAALLLGGALPDCVDWPSYQQQSSRGDAYMNPWAVNRINNLCANLPLTDSLADTRFKALALISPAYGMLFEQKSFAYLYPPVLLVCVGKDIFNQSRLHCGKIAKLLGDKARLLNLPEADAGALFSACPPALAEELPELCNSVSGEERLRIHSLLKDALLAFFRHYLTVTTNIPVIPDPPDLKPKEPEEPVKKDQPVRKKSARQRN